MAGQRFGRQRAGSLPCRDGDGGGRRQAAYSSGSAWAWRVGVIDGVEVAVNVGVTLAVKVAEGVSASGSSTGSAVQVERTR